MQRAFTCDLLKSDVRLLYINQYRPSQQLLIWCVASHSRWRPAQISLFCNSYTSAPTRCIICATLAKSIMLSICKCSSNILVTFCWFQLVKRVARCQSWWKTNLNSWSVRCVFIWHRHLLTCIVFKNMFINQHSGVKMTSYSHDMSFHQENGWTHASLQNI